MADSIVLSLTHSPAPGVQWEYDVRIEATVSGHRVVAKDLDTGRMRTVRRSRTAVTWRAAVADLIKVEETWLWGDFRADVAIDGIHGWQADMLRLAACRIDGCLSREAELLIQLSDTAIERVAELWGSLIEEPTLAVVQRLVEVHAETDAVAVIEDHVLRATPEDGKSPQIWLERVREACEGDPGLGPSASEVRSLRDAPAFLALAKGPPSRSPAVRALLFRKWVELVLPITFERTSWKLGDQPELVAAEWILAACSKPGEIARASESDPALKSALERFESAVYAFVQNVSAIPEASSYPAGMARLVQRKAAVQAATILRSVLGVDCGDDPPLRPN